MLDQKLLAILVCPLCKGDLHYDKDNQELICRRHTSMRYNCFGHSVKDVMKASCNSAC